MKTHNTSLSGLAAAPGSPFLTVTGADERTDIAALSKLDAEIGLLYSATPEGRNRYPSRQWILSAAQHLPRCALHICGKLARVELIEGRLDDILPYVQRIQVNGIVHPEVISSLCKIYGLHVFITQHTPTNKALLNVTDKNHVILIDGSGGRGILPTGWPLIDTPKHVGFAGGLGPDNLQDELSAITKVSKRGWWVDMESKLRVDDWFSLELAGEVIAQFSSVNASVEARQK